MPTLKDIANRAGVNISTVSKALRDSTDINKDTKIRIKKIAKDINYLVKPVKTKDIDEFGLIGIICPEVKSNYYSQIVSYIQEGVQRKGYSVIIGCTDFKIENERRYLKKLIKSNCAGIIFISESTDINDMLGEYKSETSIPLVMIAQNTDTKDFDCIRVDDDYGVRLGIEHLISSGHRKIGYIGDELSNTRLKTFLTVLKENKLDINKNWIQESVERFEKCGYDLILNIIKSGEMPTAFMGAYDDIAIGAMKALQDEGFAIPDDISIVGIDDIRGALYCRPELTTVAGPIIEMCRIANKLLFKKINESSYNVVQNIKLSPILVERKTVKDLN